MNATNVQYEFGHECAFKEPIKACDLLGPDIVGFGIDQGVEMGVFVRLESVGYLVHNIVVFGYAKSFDMSV